MSRTFLSFNGFDGKSLVFSKISQLARPHDALIVAFVISCLICAELLCVYPCICEPPRCMFIVDYVVAVIVVVFATASTFCRVGYVVYVYYGTFLKKKT